MQLICNTEDRDIEVRYIYCVRQKRYSYFIIIFLLPTVNPLIRIVFNFAIRTNLSNPVSRICVRRTEIFLAVFTFVLCSHDTTIGS